MATNKEHSVRCRMFNSRIFARIDFSAEGLTAGLNPQNNVLSRDFLTNRGLKQYPRKSNLTLGYCPLRFPSLALRQTCLKRGLDGLGF